MHRYRELDLDIVEAVIRKSLDDLLAFAQTLRPALRVTRRAESAAVGAARFGR